MSDSASKKSATVTPLTFARKHPVRPVSLLEQKNAEARLERELMIAECRKNHPAGKGLHREVATA